MGTGRLSATGSHILSDASPRQPTRRESRLLVKFSTLVICGLVLVPIVSLAGVAVSGSGAEWPHLIRNVLPSATLTTLWLLVLVAALTASIGVVSAWLVVAYDFPLRRTLAWALVLPLAVPPYLAAYAFAEFFHFTGPVQGAIRAIFGFRIAGDYWFPDVRSTPGAAFVLASVLYPYVYLTARIVFLMQGRNIADVALTLGARPGKVFWRVLLPVARPAIAAGVALVLMETINDIGASEYLGVRTLTFSVFTTWLNRGSLEGAAQIAMLMLALVFALVVAEQWARRRQRFHIARASQMRAHPPRVSLAGWRGGLALFAAGMPIAFGFGIPVYMFARYSSRRLDQFVSPELGDALLNSILTAGATAVITVCVALLLTNALRLVQSRGIVALVRLASIGYALPGTIMGLGLLFALARFDNTIDAFFRAEFGFSTGLLLTGSAAAVVMACSIRFTALAEGAIRSGVEKLPPHLDEAARSLGRSPTQSAMLILLPLLRPAILTAAVLVFVDTVKELSATILLRPFGFNTLATSVYENASRAAIEETGPAALLIIITALVPVVLLSRALAQDRQASL